MVMYFPKRPLAFSNTTQIPKSLKIEFTFAIFCGSSDRMSNHMELNISENSVYD